MFDSALEICPVLPGDKFSPVLGNEVLRTNSLATCRGGDVRRLGRGASIITKRL
jgi:hypothetical protein